MLQRCTGCAQFTGARETTLFFFFHHKTTSRVQHQQHMCRMMTTSTKTTHIGEQSRGKLLFWVFFSWLKSVGQENLQCLFALTDEKPDISRSLCFPLLYCPCMRK